MLHRRTPKADAEVPFNHPSLSGRELTYIREVLESRRLAAGGTFSRRVEELLRARLGAPKVLLTHSCTGALEIAAALTVSDGDEVILPSFAYATTASAFVRAGARLVFVDIRPDTLNIDPARVEEAITERTRAVIGVHYAGVGCDIDGLRNVASAAGIAFIEDAAHGLGATFRGQPLGAFGRMATFSFHETKNVTSGEGGALVINDESLIDRAEIIRDRGTNRQKFLAGAVDAYEWMDVGSAYAPPEIVAAFLLAQLEDLDAITEKRVKLWRRYRDALEPLERDGLLQRPSVPVDAAHNGHIYFALVEDASDRGRVLSELRESGIGVTSHFVPLHGTPAGVKYGRTGGPLPVTESVAARIVRLPMHLSLSDADQDRVVEALFGAVTATGRPGRPAAGNTAR
jgi:dTDP-4-amino-4,6-dideoxygalactose transaminase